MKEKQNLLMEAYLEFLAENDEEALLELHRKTKRFLINSLVFSIYGAAYTFYKEYMTKAGKACNQVDGKVAHAKCLRNFKIKALMGFNEKLKAGMSSCNKADSPEKKTKCINKLKEKIAANINKIENLKKLG
jgi:hypothetical protein